MKREMIISRKYSFPFHHAARSYKLTLICLRSLNCLRGGRTVWCSDLSGNDLSYFKYLCLNQSIIGVKSFHKKLHKTICWVCSAVAVRKPVSLVWTEEIDWFWLHHTPYSRQGDNVMNSPTAAVSRPCMTSALSAQPSLDQNVNISSVWSVFSL